MTVASSLQTLQGFKGNVKLSMTFIGLLGIAANLAYIMSPPSVWHRTNNYPPHLLHYSSLQKTFICPKNTNQLLNKMVMQRKSRNIETWIHVYQISEFICKRWWVSVLLSDHHPHYICPAVPSGWFWACIHLPAPCFNVSSPTPSCPCPPFQPQLKAGFALHLICLAVCIPEQT